MDGVDHEVDLRTCTVCNREGLDTYHRAGHEDVNACASCIGVHWPGPFAFPTDGVPIFKGWLDNFSRDMPDQMRSIAGLNWGLS